MLWRGRLTPVFPQVSSVKSISINWNYSSSVIGLSIDTDGLMYGQQSYSDNLPIYIVIASGRSDLQTTQMWSPTLTSGQKNAITKLIGAINTDHSNIVISSSADDPYLCDYLQSVLNS